MKIGLSMNLFNRRDILVVLERLNIIFDCGKFIYSIYQEKSTTISRHEIIQT